jgi:osmotically-inducible protein OsmY
MQKTRFSLAAILLAALMAACGGSPTKESTGEYIDDTAITTKVMTAFAKDKEVKVTEIKVDTFKGNVQLSGFASTREEIDQAVHLASQVPGVRSVRNDIQLKPK